MLANTGGGGAKSYPNWLEALQNTSIYQHKTTNLQGVWLEALEAARKLAERKR